MSEMIGENEAESAPGSMTIHIDCIQDIHETNNENSCMLETINGSNIQIFMSYIDLKKVWIKALELQAGVFFASYLDPQLSGIKNSEKVGIAPYADPTGSDEISLQ